MSEITSFSKYARKGVVAVPALRGDTVHTERKGC